MSNSEVVRRLGNERRLQKMSISSLNENLMETRFMKRECVRFVAHEKDPNKCVCGRLKTRHAGVVIPVLNGGSVVRTTYPGGPVDRWTITGNTEPCPTDAYGTIEFQGGPHPTKAQYVRLSYDTRPEKILSLLQERWGLELPNLLISVHGGIANFDLQPKLRRVCRQGLLKAAKTIGAWIITAGTNTGVVKHVGEALGDTLVQSKSNIVTIGIAPWGAVHSKDDLIGHDVVVPYHAIASPRSNSVVLNSNHSYFLLVDDGTVDKFGGEISLRKKFENYISQQKISTRSSAKAHSTPVVCLVMEGGSNTIRTVLECVTDHPPVPAVVIDGTGRAADLIAFTHKYAQDDGTMPDVLRDQLRRTIESSLHYSTELAEKILLELMLCVKRKHLITVFRVGEQSEDIDLSILAALLKGQNSSAPDQLSLALAWNRSDIARSNIFIYGQEWPDGALDQAMMDALVNDRVDFVRLLIENGVSMHRWLTVERLEELYNLCLNRKKALRVQGIFASNRQIADSSSTLLYLLNENKKNTPSDYMYTLVEIGQVISKLMSGAYRSTYCRKKFRFLHAAITNQGHNVGNIVNGISVVFSAPTINNRFKYPYSELMQWAILLRRHNMSKFMWEHGEEALAKAIVAYHLNHQMAIEAEQVDLEDDVSREIGKYSEEFADLSMELLEQCYKINDELTQMLLTYHLSNWSDQTCLSLAVCASHRELVGQTCCQILLTKMWMGALRARKYTNLKVLLGILCPPFILLLEYRSREELQMMPQTLEEHQHDLNDSDSSDCDTDSDAGSVSSKKSNSSKMRHTSKLSDGSFSLPGPVQRTSSSERRKSERLRRLRLASPLDVNSLKFKQAEKDLRITKKIYEFYTAPITKFWLHTMSYVIFLLMYIYFVLPKTPDTPSHVEWYLVAYMVGFSVDKIREFTVSEPVLMKQKLSLFFFDIWNLFDVTSVILFFIGLILRFQPLPLGNARVFYALALSVCVVRILDSFAVSPHLGPFVHIIGKMMRELVQFVVILLVFIISFGSCRQSIWYPDDDFDWGQVRDIFIKPYFMLYGEVFSEEIWPECVDEVTDIKTEFKCVPFRWVVPIVLSVFMVIGMILLLSLLVALFNSIFMRTYIHSKSLWKCRRYLLVIEYENKPMLPPPFILLSHIYMMIKYLINKCRQKKQFRDNGLKLFLNEDDVELLHDFEEECMEIYYREKKNRLRACNDERLRVTAEHMQNLDMKLDDLRGSEKSTCLSMQMIDARVTTLGELATKTSDSLHQIQKQLISVTQMQAELSTAIRSVAAASTAYAGKQRESSDMEEKHTLLNEDDPSSALSEKNQKASGMVISEGNERRDSVISMWSERSEPSLLTVIKERLKTSDIQAADEQLLGICSHQFVGFDDRKSSVSGVLPSKLLLLVSPPHTITSPANHSAAAEYSSITDSIDTSCIDDHSPPCTPRALSPSPQHPVPTHSKRHRQDRAQRHRMLTRTASEAKKEVNEKLREVEEEENSMLEVIMHTRIRQLSLTGNGSDADLAQLALKVIGNSTGDTASGIIEADVPEHDLDVQIRINEEEDNRGDNLGDNRRDSPGDNRDNRGDDPGDDWGDKRRDNRGDKREDNRGDNPDDNPGENLGSNTFPSSPDADSSGYVEMITLNDLSHKDSVDSYIFKKSACKVDDYVDVALKLNDSPHNDLADSHTPGRKSLRTANEYVEVSSNDIPHKGATDWRSKSPHNFNEYVEVGSNDLSCKNAAAFLVDSLVKSPPYIFNHYIEAKYSCDGLDEGDDDALSFKVPVEDELDRCGCCANNPPDNDSVTAVRKSVHSLDKANLPIKANSRDKLNSQSKVKLPDKTNSLDNAMCIDLIGAQQNVLTIRVTDERNEEIEVISSYC